MSVKVMVIDDNVRNIRLLTDILGDEGYEVYSLGSSMGVVQLVHSIKPDIILLDIMMPWMDGFEVCAQLKRNYEIKDIPVIMVTAKTEGVDIKKAFEVGAFDYIKKPVDEVEVIARVQSALRFKQQQDQLRELAMRDGLTGIYNHALLVDLFEKELLKSERNGSSISFIMLDIDYFKNINDTYGHTVGDVILKELTGILTQNVRKCDVVGRYGGEEFSIVLPEMGLDHVVSLCENLRKTVERNEFNKGDNGIHITISIGICFKEPQAVVSYQQMIKNADESLYKA